jgi:hypothetical protein
MFTPFVRRRLLGHTVVTMVGRTLRSADRRIPVLVSVLNQKVQPSLILLPCDLSHVLPNSGNDR